MSETAPTSDVLLNRRHAYLLHQLATAPDGRLPQSEADKTTPKQIKQELRLTPAKEVKELRRGMVASGWVAEEKSGRVVTHAITEAGRQHLGELERYIPLRPAKGIVNPPADDGLGVVRELYVLDALSRAARQTISKVDLDAGFGNKPKAAELAAEYPDVVAFRTQECLKLNAATARAVLSELALRGDIVVHRLPDSESYSLAPSGAELLGRLRGECPVLPPTGKPAPATNEAIRLAREAFLLLKLLEAPKHSATAVEADQVGPPKPLKLNPATAWQVRRELARQGHVAVRWDGKEGSYALTPSGRRHLATLSFDAFGEVKIKGPALTHLLAAAREVPVAAPTATPSQPQTPRPQLTDGQLEAAVLDVFRELLRERFTVTGMVPIHEIRREVAERFGPQSASHAVLDEVLLELRRARQVKLISISDRSRATPEQLQDSVFAVGETFFYVEKANAPAQGG